MKPLGNRVPYLFYPCPTHSSVDSFGHFIHSISVCICVCARTCACIRMCARACVYLIFCSSLPWSIILILWSVHPTVSLLLCPHPPSLCFHGLRWFIASLILSICPKQFIQIFHNILMFHIFTRFLTRDFLFWFEYFVESEFLNIWIWESRSPSEVMPLWIENMTTFKFVGLNPPRLISTNTPSFYCTTRLFSRASQSRHSKQLRLVLAQHWQGCHVVHHFNIPLHWIPSICYLDHCCRVDPCTDWWSIGWLIRFDHKASMIAPASKILRQWLILISWLCQSIASSANRSMRTHNYARTRASSMLSHVVLTCCSSLQSGVEDWVHRVGRTGRAGAKGFAHTFGECVCAL